MENIAGLAAFLEQKTAPDVLQVNDLGSPLSRSGARFDHFIDFPLPGLPGGAQVIFELEAKPEFGRRPQVSRQAQGGIGRDSPAAAHYIIQARCRDAQCFGELIHAHIQRLQNVLAYCFAGMGRRY